MRRPSSTASRRDQAGRAAPWLMVIVLLVVAVLAGIWLMGDEPVEDTDSGPSITEGEDKLVERDLPEPAPDREQQPEPEPELTGGSVVGQVVTTDYRPVQGATVSAMQGTASLFPQMIRELPSFGVRALSDADGNFELQEVPPTAELIVRFSGGEFAVTESGPYSVRSGEITDLGTVVVPPGLRIRGNVNDDRARPIEGVKVGLIQTRLTGDWAWRDVKPSTVVLTDSEGLFNMPGVRSGKYHIVTEAEGYGNGLWQGNIGLDGETEAWVSLVLYDGITLEGRIIGSPGAIPLPGARVVAMPLRNDGGNGKVETATDDEGTYRLEGLAPGHYTIGAQAPGYRRRGFNVQLPHDRDVSLRLPKNGSLQGFVLNADGKPATSFDIQAYRHFRAHFDGVKEGPFQRIRSSNGAFKIDDLREGIYSVEVWSRNHAVTQTEPIWVDQGEEKTELIVRLDRGSSLAGQVLDIAGNAVPDAVISMNFNAALDVDIITASAPKQTRMLTTQTGELGKFLLEGLVPDTYKISVDHPEYAMFSRRDVIVAAGQENDMPETVVLEPAGSISGTVIDDGGLPQADARVRIYADWGLSKEIRANGRGEYRFDRLSSGDYRISAIPSKTGAVSLSTVLEMSFYAIETGDSLVINLAPGQDLHQNVLTTRFD